jgi:hypothetical protein
MEVEFRVTKITVSLNTRCTQKISVEDVFFTCFELHKVKHQFAQSIIKDSHISIESNATEKLYQ